MCAAAAIPPLFDLARWEGRPVVDAGMADKAPMPDSSEGSTLILRTRQFRQIPQISGRTYVAPSHETPADKVDFTDPAKLRRTWALGESDGRAWLNAGGNPAE